MRRTLLLLLRASTRSANHSYALLVLLPPPVNPTLALFQRLPLIGRLLQPPDLAQWGASAVYRIRLLPRTTAACKPLTCDDALLLAAIR